MRRRTRKPHIEITCDYCGSKTDRFVATPDYLRFCRHQYVGFPPEKDCMGDYYRSKSNVRKNELRQKKADEEKKEISKEEKEKVIKKFDDYLFELKQKQRRQRATK